MINRLNFALASRMFESGRQHNLVAFIARIAITGVALAVAILIVVLSVMNGFDYEFRNKILGLVPHASLTFTEPASNWDATIQEIKEMPEVISAQPFVELSGLAVHGVKVQPLVLRGVEYPQFTALFGGYINPLADIGVGDIVLGAGIAKKLSVDVGDKIRLLVQAVDTRAGNSYLSHDGAAAQSVVFRVSSILTTGTEIDTVAGIIALQTAAKLAGHPNSVQGIHLQVNDIFNVQQIGARLFYGSDYYFARYSDWSQSYGNLYVAIQLSRQMVVALLAIIVAVGVFNVFVTLGMLVRYKHGDIAILRTMGLSKKRVRRVFIYQGFLIAIPGCLIGTAIGVFVAYFIPEVAGLVEQIFHIEFLSTEVYPIDYLPSKIVLGDIGMIILVTLVMTFLATLLPARRAANLQPAKVLNDQVS